MNEEQLELNAIDKLLLERSSDTDLTRRRLRAVIVSAILLIAALVVAALLTRSWELLLFFAVAYVATTAWERVAYARTILAYKGLIQKLAARVDELERDGVDA